MGMMLFQEFKVPFTFSLESSIKIKIKIKVCAKTKAKIRLQRPWQVNSKNGLALKDSFINFFVDFFSLVSDTLNFSELSYYHFVEWLVFFPSDQGLEVLKGWSFMFLLIILL
jgi:hypothetical protein